MQGNNRSLRTRNISWGIFLQNIKEQDDRHRKSSLSNIHVCTHIHNTHSPSLYHPLSDLHTLKSGSFKREKMLYYHFLNTRQIFPCRNERLMRQGRGRILLGNNTGSGVVILWLIRCLCVEVWISTGLPCI
jgi:hypothetical protein